MGALTEQSSHRPRARGRGGRLARGLPGLCSPSAGASSAAAPGSTSSSTRAWGGWASATGGGGRAGADGGGDDPTSRSPASGPTSPPPTRPTTPSSRAARPLPAGRRGRCARRTRAAPPRRQQRRDAARAGATSTWSAAGWRSTASIPSGVDPATAGSSPPSSSRSYVADVKRFERGDRAGLRAGLERTGAETSVGVLPIGYGDGSGEGSPTTRRCWSAAAATRSWARSRWTTSRSTLGPSRRRAGSGGGADRRLRAASGCSPRSSPSASRRSTTRSPAGSRRRVPREFAGAR